MKTILSIFIIGALVSAFSTALYKQNFTKQAEFPPTGWIITSGGNSWIHTWVWDQVYQPGNGYARGEIENHAGGLETGWAQFTSPNHHLDAGQAIHLRFRYIACYQPDPFFPPVYHFYVYIRLNGTPITTLNIGGSTGWTWYQYDSTQPPLSQTSDNYSLAFYVYNYSCSDESSFAYFCVDDLSVELPSKVNNIEPASIGRMKASYH